MIEDKEKIIEEEEQEIEFYVEVSGTFHVMAENPEDAERFVREQLYDGSGYYVNELDITAEGDD